MRLLPALALLLPASVWAGMAEYIADSYEGASMGMDEMRLLSWYAIAICVFVAVKSLFGHGRFDPKTPRARGLKALMFAAAAVFGWHFPQATGLIMLALLTAMIVLLGVSRK